MINSIKKLIGSKKSDKDKQDAYYFASQWQLIRRKFFRHRLAMIGFVMLIILYIGTMFSGFLAPYNSTHSNSKLVFSEPQGIHFIDKTTGFHIRPFIYGVKKMQDPDTWAVVYKKDYSKMIPIKFFIDGDKYTFLGIRSTMHLFGTDNNEGVNLMGTDELGRDVLTRSFYAGQISMTVGLIGVFFSFIIGVTMGGISGYYGGSVDMLIQRVVEFIMSMPTIPLWLALSAAFPQTWSSIQIYLAITVLLSMINWVRLARVVRGKMLQVRTEDYILAAKVLGLKERTIIMRHMLPSFTTQLIVTISLSIPGMILAETSLSFLGLGIRPPAVSWGTMLQDAQTIDTIYNHPWLLFPALLVICTVLGFNFVGDGLRDAADPYK